MTSTEVGLRLDCYLTPSMKARNLPQFGAFETCEVVARSAADDEQGEDLSAFFFHNHPPPLSAQPAPFPPTVSHILIHNDLPEA